MMIDGQEEEIGVVSSAVMVDKSADGDGESGAAMKSPSQLRGGTKRHYKKDTRYLYDLYTLTYDNHECLELVEEHSAFVEERNCAEVIGRRAQRFVYEYTANGDRQLMVF